MECFYEQFIANDNKRLQWTLDMVSKFILVLTAIYLIAFRWIGALTFIFIYILIILIARNVFVEYEYELTNDELVVFKIMNKSKRKTIATLNVNNITEIKEVNEVKEKSKVITACLKGKNLKEKIVFFKTSLGIIGFHLAMDEELINLMSKMNPIAFRNI